MIIKRHWTKAGLVSGLIGSSLISHAQAQPLFVIDSAPPPGFENLNQPQRSMIDVYYGDRYVGTQMATFSTKNIHFSDPKALLEKISNISAPDVVLNALSTSLSTNSNQVCYEQSQQDCGLLAPKIAGVIFDESKMRANIFINSSYLRITPATANIFLPDSDAGKSFIQQAQGTLSGSDGPDGSSSDYTFTGSSIFGVKENNFQANYDYSKSNHLSLNNAFFEREYHGKVWQGGLLTTNGFGMAFSSDNPMLGLHIGSSDNTRLDDGISEGTALQVFMPVRGRIDVIKDGRLIYTTFAEAGNHLLNTSGFPSGSYDVTIRVRDSSGRVVSNQTRFFARENSLPKTGVPDYFFEAGKIVSRQSENVIPNTTSNLIARTGINYRLGETWAGTAALAATQGQSFSEFSVFHIGRHYKITPGFMYSSNGSHGVKLNTQLFWGEWNANADYRRLWNTHNSSVDRTISTENGQTITTTTVDNFSLLQNSFEQLSYSVGTTLWGGQASYRSYYTRQSGFDSQQVNGLSYSKDLYSNNTYTFNTRFDLSQSKDDKIIQLTFTLRWNEGNFNHSVSARGDWESQNNEVKRDYNMRYDLGWNSGDTLNQDIDARLTAQKSKNQTSILGQTTIGSEYGALSGSLSQTHIKGTGSTTSYAGSFSSSLVTNGKDISIGGNKVRDSGLMVDIEGVPSSANFNVIVNGQREGVATGGKSSFIPLAPFSTYEVKLEPADAGFYNFKESIRDVTLYPGNIVSLDYRIKSLQLVFGRLMNNQGKPVTNAEVSNLKGFNNETDDNGIFQFEVPYGTKSLTFKEDGKTCEVTLPESKERTPVLRVGNAVCKTL